MFLLLLKKKEVLGLGVEAHAFNPSTQEPEAVGSLNLRPSCCTQWSLGQPGLHSETHTCVHHVFHGGFPT